MPKKYYIQPGENLVIIAHKLGVSVEHLVKMNPYSGNPHSEKNYLYY